LYLRSLRGQQQFTVQTRLAAGTLELVAGPETALMVAAPPMLCAEGAANAASGFVAFEVHFYSAA